MRAFVWEPSSTAGIDPGSEPREWQTLVHVYSPLKANDPSLTASQDVSNLHNASNASAGSDGTGAASNLRAANAILRCREVVVECSLRDNKYLRIEEKHKF